MAGLRLFVALDLPPSIKHHLAAVGERLRAAAPEASWVPRQNLHMTLAFLGHVPEERLAEISSSIGRSVAGLVDFSTALEEIGAFPSMRRARVVWAGLSDPAGGIAGVADAVWEALEPLGFERERRPFAAHVTLARLRRPAPLSLPAVELDPARFPVERVTLFRSRLQRPAPVYEAVATFPFRREPSPPRPDEE